MRKQIDTIKTPLKGFELLSHPSLNKGSAFSSKERKAFNLQGLLPEHVSTIDEQSQRIFQSLEREEDPLTKYRILSGLQYRNEVLFYYCVKKYLTDIMPIIYTPTVGLACQKYSHIFRRNRGLWITPNDQGQIKQRLLNAPQKDIRLIVVTDNESILGLGDQGAGGMAISVGKLSLYCVAAGLHPSQLLPISLDVGTNNKSILKDPLYLGLRSKRLTGDAYQACVDEFISAVKDVFPNALLQWEDFRKQNAFDLLNQYRNEILSFNDDIQGTAAVALSGIMTACKIKKESLKNQRCLVVGAGAAGIGIGQLLKTYLSQHHQNLSLEDHLALTDSKGLVSDHPDLDPYKHQLAWSAQACAKYNLQSSDSLLHVIKQFKPTILIGTSGQPKIFSQDIVHAMLTYCEEPIIMPFSNPTSLSEAHPQDLINWSHGSALIGTGSPFEPCQYQGKTYPIAQGNNVFVFPGIGLGVLSASLKTITNDIFLVAAQALSDQVNTEELSHRMLFPNISRIRDVSKQIATAILHKSKDISVEEAKHIIASSMWEPAYPNIEPHDQT